MVISADQVKKLRDQTGAGFMECKAALTEANGDLEAANTILRKRGLAQAAKKAGRSTSQGSVGSYIHMGGKMGVLVEVNCESDFVARTDQFAALVKEIAMHIAAADPKYVRREEVPSGALDKEHFHLQLPTGGPVTSIQRVGVKIKFIAISCGSSGSSGTICSSSATPHLIPVTSASNRS